MDNNFGNVSSTPLTSIERETIITYNNAEDTANVYSLNLPMLRKIRKLAEDYPDDVKILHQADDMIEATVPKSWVKIRPPRKLSDEQREAMAERGRSLYEHALAAKAAKTAKADDDDEDNKKDNV